MSLLKQSGNYDSHCPCLGLPNMLELSLSCMHQSYNSYLQKAQNPVGAKQQEITRYCHNYTSICELPLRLSEDTILKAIFPKNVWLKFEIILRSFLKNTGSQTLLYYILIQQG